MNPRRLLRASAMLCVCLGVAASGDSAGGPPRADSVDVGLRAHHAPLNDPNAGRLYPATLRLLAASRVMPGRIELADVAGRGSAAEPAPAEPLQTEQQAPAEPPRSDESTEQNVVTVVDGPVVPQGDLAHAFYMAGRHLAAAAVYRQLLEKEPGDDYLAMMLMLCERNSGNLQQTRELLDRLQDSEAAKEWAEWMTAMIALGDQTSEEAE